MKDNTDNNWRIWDEDQKYGNDLYKRAVGELGEMESSKAFAKVLKKEVGDESFEMLDIGCGVGHYLKSVLYEIDENKFKYTGIDATAYYVELANKAWQNQSNAEFKQADAFDLPYEDSSFDLVSSSNLLLHLPSIAKPIAEMIRVAKKKVIIRSLFGDRSFRIQDVWTAGFQEDSEGALDFDSETGDPRSFHYFNIYSKTYVENLLHTTPKVKSFQISDDWDYNTEAFAEDRALDKAEDASHILGKWQVNGYIMQPWAFVVIELND